MDWFMEFKFKVNDPFWSFLLRKIDATPQEISLHWTNLGQGEFRITNTHRLRDQWRIYRNNNDIMSNLEFRQFIW